MTSATDWHRIIVEAAAQYLTGNPTPLHELVDVLEMITLIAAGSIVDEQTRKPRTIDTHRTRRHP